MTTGNKQEWLYTAESVKALPDEGGTPPEWFYKAGILLFAGDAIFPGGTPPAIMQQLQSMGGPP